MIPTDPRTGQPVAMTFEQAVQSLLDCEDFLRSVIAVADRKGEETNWETFANAARKRIKELQDGFGWKFAIQQGDVATAKSFRQMRED